MHQTAAPAWLRYLRAEGRISRIAYWNAMLFILLGLTAMGILLDMVRNNPPPIVAVPSMLLVYLWSNTIIRRGHDFGAPGWLTLPFAFLVSFTTMQFAGGTLWAVAPNILLFIVLGSIPGDVQANRHGAPAVRHKVRRQAKAAGTQGSSGTVQ